MLSERIINHMEADELRNLIHHYGDLNNRQKELIMIKNDVIEDLTRLCKDMGYSDTIQESCRKREKMIEGLEEEMKEKYKAYLPKPFLEKDIEGGEDYEVCQETEEEKDGDD